MSKRPPRVMLSAGEASGDRLGAGLARALRARVPEIELFGMGGPQMAAAGVRIVQDSAEVAVVGISEVLKHLGAIRGAMRRLERCMRDEPPDLLVPIDFPDFNLRLAARAGRAAVDVVYFVSPQVWAWRRGRVRRIRELVRCMLVLFPFEVAFYEEAGVPVRFVGHPAVEAPAVVASPQELARRAGLDPELDTLALMPGSRRIEIERLLPPILAAAGLVAARHLGVQFLVPLAPGVDVDTIRQQVAQAGLDRVRLHAGDFPEILRTCVAGVTASGTASLEAALVGLPVVVVYRMSALSHRIARALIRIDRVALPNLIAGHEVVPELLQDDCRPERIAERLSAWLDDPDERERVRAGLADVRHRLGRPGVFERAAEAVIEHLP